MGCIYKITNTLSGKSYIGQTRQDAEKTRIRDHLAGKGNRIVKQAIAKYGKDAFTFEILHDGIIPEFLDTLEIEAIAKHNTLAPHGYNLTTGGDGGSRSEEARRKISEAMKHPDIRRKQSESKKGENNPMKRPEVRRKHAESMRHPDVRQRQAKNNAMKRPEVRQKHSEAVKQPDVRRKHSEAVKGENNPMYGKTHSKEAKRKMSENNAMKRPEVRRKISGENSPTKRSEVRRKISEAHTGKTLSDEHRRKISQAQKGKPGHWKDRKFSDEHRQKISKALEDRKFSDEHRQKISQAQRSPEYIPAREFFFSLPSNMILKEKRRLLHQKITGVHRGTINNWVRKWTKDV